MKSLLRKGIVAMLMLVMLMQMTGSAFASSVDWEANSYYYTAYVNKGTRLEKVVAFKSVDHMKGAANTITIVANASVTSNCIGLSFPNTYSNYLYQCLNSEGLDDKETYTNDILRTYTVESDWPAGVYQVVQKFIGYSGTWGVLRATSSDDARSYITSGSFTYAPSSATGVPYLNPSY